MKLLAIFLGMFLFLAGCSTTTKQESSNEIEQIEPIEVNIIIHPSPVEINNETTFEATVTQGSETVDDASNVEFEIWKNGVEDHIKIVGKNQGKGVYSIKETLNEVGTYNVIVHVTAKDMHIMPKREFAVVDLSTKNELQPQPQQANAEHHHGSGVLIQFMDEAEVYVNKETELKVHISLYDKPLQSGNTRFEVWKEGQKHEFIKATETGDGEYVASKVFNELGSYNIKVHVENNEIHEHRLKTITVK